MAVELSAAQKRDEGIASLGTRNDIELAILPRVKKHSGKSSPIRLNGFDRWRADRAAAGLSQ
jgi:hypothetical protein